MDLLNKQSCIKISQESFFNYVLGLSVLSWAFLGLYYQNPETRFTSVRLVITAVHLTVGLLILMRTKQKILGSVSSLLLCLPGLIVAGFALKLSALQTKWALDLQILFAVGGFFTILSFISLGRSFAILPSLREIKTFGTYKIVRHPAYLGELVMILACGLSTNEAITLLPFVFAIVFIVIRIEQEEKVLNRSEDYLVYKKKVPWRLIPKLW